MITLQKLIISKSTNNNKKNEIIILGKAVTNTLGKDRSTRDEWMRPNSITKTIRV